MAFETKKSLGQNFLTSQGAIQRIADFGALASEDVVLEVGPGEGALTEKLLLKARKVLAIEKDDRLIPLLSQKFAAEIAAGKLELVHGDALEFDPRAHGLEEGKYKVVANIPYYITGIFIRRYLSETAQPSHMVLLLQKEVVERIVANDGKESILSLSVKAYGAPKNGGVIKAGSFRPAPKVDSAILIIENISKKFFEASSESVFFAIIKASFAEKRKQFRKNVRKLLEENSAFASRRLEEKEKIMTDAFATAGIPEKSRAEDVALQQWKKLAEEVSKIR